MPFLNAAAFPAGPPRRCIISRVSIKRIDDDWSHSVLAKLCVAPSVAGTRMRIGRCMAVGDTLMNYYKESTTTIATTIFVDVVVAGKSGRCPGAPTRQ